MKRVMIEYTLGEDAPVADVEQRIGEFVAGMRSLEAGIRYTSHRKRDTERAYVHVAVIPDEDAFAKMQSAAFFKSFSEYLPTVCSQKPRVTWLDMVASTES
jgi:quinol monooxygenase YgiN